VHRRYKTEAEVGQVTVAHAQSFPVSAVPWSKKKVRRKLQTCLWH